MSDVLTIATRRLETLKAEVAKIEQFLAFAAELAEQDSTKLASATPTKAPVDTSSKLEASQVSNTDRFQLRERATEEDKLDDLRKLSRG